MIKEQIKAELKHIKKTAKRHNKEVNRLIDGEEIPKNMMDDIVSKFFASFENLAYLKEKIK